MDMEPKKIESMDDLRAAMNDPEIQAASKEFSKKYLKANRPKSLAVVLFAVARGENVKPVGKGEHRVLLDGLGILVDRGCGMVHAVIDCLRKNVHLRKLRFLERGLDGQTLVQNRAVFELLELRTHETARRGRPGAVFDQRNGPVLEVVVHNVMDQIFHVHEHAGIIGCGEEDQVAGAEAPLAVLEPRSRMPQCIGPIL